jgi:NAD(P)-dependent dehydrogenase (short-subunit alcohol dehydrogenase family)
MQDLNNKIALVTGAGAGIGHAICKALSTAGATVIAVARDKENLERLKQELPAGQHQCWSIDLSDDAGQQELVERLEAFGFPHIVVCNLHIPTEKKRLINTTKENFSKGFTVNIDHLFAIMEKTLQFQRSEKFGRWIGISSLSVNTGSPGKSIYNAQKSVMESLFLNLAVEEGKYGITANIVAPGLIETPTTVKGISKEIFEKVSSFNVMKRAGTPAEVAAAVSFLVSMGASYITGINLPVNGGAQLTWQLS